MINVDGTENHLLLNTGPSVADWSPDGSWIAFCSNGRIYKAELDAGAIDTSSIQGLTDESDGICYFPSWSPDGIWIAYDCDPEGHEAVWKVRSDGSEKLKIKDWARQPDFAPRGNRILYLKWFLGQAAPEIFTMDLTTDEETQVTHLRKDVRDPEYSPDAARILFLDYDICIVDTNGTNLHRITSVVGYDPSWGPSGKEIVFIRSNHADWRNDGLVYIMNDDGSGLHRLTRGAK
jgi:Tol biopolymer transport system component